VLESIVRLCAINARNFISSIKHVNLALLQNSQKSVHFAQVSILMLTHQPVYIAMMPIKVTAVPPAKPSCLVVAFAFLAN